MVLGTSKYNFQSGITIWFVSNHETLSKVSELEVESHVTKRNAKTVHDVAKWLSLDLVHPQYCAYPQQVPHRRNCFLTEDNLILNVFTVFETCLTRVNVVFVRKRKLENILDKKFL